MTVWKGPRPLSKTTKTETERGRERERETKIYIEKMFFFLLKYLRS